MLPVPMQYGTGHGGRHGGTTPSQMSPTERGIVNPEREVESERMWWAEASERQVHELESTFQAEFTRACQALRAELGSSKDKLEMKVEDDRLAAQDRMNELRRMIESQGALVADIARKVEDERLAAQESMRELRWMIDNQAALVADVSRKADMTQLHRDAMPAVMPTDLRNELDALLLAQRRADQESAASFTGVKARVDAIQADVAHLRGETVPLLRSEIDAVQAEKLRTDEETSSSLEAVKQRVESVLADMANLRGDTVPRLRSELDDMVVARLQKDQAAAASMDAVSARVDAMQACLADVRRERVETTVPQSPLQADSAHLHANIVPLLRSELDAMQAASLRADKEISSSLDALKTRVDGIQEASMALDAIRTRMDAVQADVAHLRGDTVPLLRSELDALQAAQLHKGQETASVLQAMEVQLSHSIQETSASLHLVKARIDSFEASLADVCQVCFGAEESQSSEKATPFQRVVPPPEASRAASAPGPSLLSPDLKTSIEGLVQRVNQTLTRPRDPTPVPAVSGLLQQPGAPGAAAVASARPGSPTRYLTALHEVNELRERNLSLRERNAELVEELLTHDGGCVLPPDGIEGVLDQTYTSSASAGGVSANLSSFVGGGALNAARLTSSAAPACPGASMRLSNPATPAGVRSPVLRGRSLVGQGSSMTPQLHLGMSGCASAKPQANPLRQHQQQNTPTFNR